MITLDEYVGIHANSPDWTPQRRAAATAFLLKVNAQIREIYIAGVMLPVNPKTKSQISGETFGGFRPQDCPIGAPKSCHKEAIGIDLFDPEGAIDAWCMANLARLAANGLWLEHSDATPGWCHWQGRGVPSGNRVFRP
jgi:hypothetical protein